MVLGDATLKSTGRRHIAHDPRKHLASLSFGHSKKQKDYAIWKIELCRNYLTFNFIKEYKVKVKEKEYDVFLTNSKGSRKLSYLYAKMYQFRKKRVTQKILNRLTPLGLAIFYMDDGNLDKKKRPDGSYYPYRTIRLATNCFSALEVTLFQKTLEKRWGIKTKVTKNNRGHLSIYIHKKDAMRFLDVVRPFVSQVDCMKYKLPEFENIEAPRIPGQDIVRASEKSEEGNRNDSPTPIVHSAE